MSSWRFGSGAGKRPSLHAGRPRRSAADFAATFFTDSPAEVAAARSVFATLERLSHRDLSGLEPDDPIGDLFPPSEDLRRIEAKTGADFEPGSARENVARELLDELHWRSLLGELLGSAASSCSWDPRTLPQRSVRGVVAEVGRHLAASSTGDTGRK